MPIVTRIDEVRAAVDEARRRGARIGFVPTMGALHAGHLSLVREARRRTGGGGGRGYVVLSVFVNPTQFGPGEDFDAYPRDLQRDARLAEEAGVDLVFAPAARELYPEGFRTRVEVTQLSEPLCGRARPGHFAGVALVVAKLLNIVRPDLSVFGQKDAQQAVIVRRLARDLSLPGEIVVAPTVRELDGLAMSSRNAYLSSDQRRAARAISRGLFAAAGAWSEGERDAARLVALVRDSIAAESLLAPEYVEMVGAEDLSPWTGEGPALLAVAARCGPTRLIDNVVLAPSPVGALETPAREGR
ncbi:MAG: pantoate--beta-alanine ligase [bacterium]